MRIGAVILDTDKMTLEDMDTIIKELRDVRVRKRSAHAFKAELSEIIAHMQEEGFSFTNRFTGEILKPSDWWIYDALSHCTHGLEVE